MSTIAAARRIQIARTTEARKLAAFVRRDFLVAWSYRLSFVGDIVGLVGATFIFYFVGLMVDPAKIPPIAGTEVTYLEFAAIGMTLGGFLQLGLDRVSTAVRGEQLMGTLESVLATPTSPTTVQLGSVLFDLAYIPIRMGLLLAALALTFGLGLEVGGIPEALAVLAVFMPFVWGLGVFAAATTLTFRRGGGLISLGTLLLTLGSGVYFPVELLPDAATTLATANPIAIAVNSIRESLLAGTGWGEAAPAIARLIPLSLLSLALGAGAFKLALRRERRLGTLGVY